MIDIMTIIIDDFDDYDDGEDIDKQSQVAIADNFSYVDPVDGSKAAKQGIRVNTIITTTTTTINTSTTITSDTIIIITQGSQIICDRYDVIYHDNNITSISSSSWEYKGALLRRFKDSFQTLWHGKQWSYSQDVRL